MNLYKVKYSFQTSAFMIIEAEDIDEVTERFDYNTQGVEDAKISEVVRLDEVPETAPVSRKELN